jgi:hypothetical protein
MAKLLSFGKTFFWAKSLCSLYFLTKLLSLLGNFFFMVKLLYLNKPSLYFVAKPLSLGQTFLFFGKTFNSWQNQ